MDLTGPLDPHALSEAQALLKSLPQIAGEGAFIDHIPMHWAVETYEMDDKAYNCIVALANGQWLLLIATEPTLNATIPEQAGYAEHTAGRNGHGCGIAVEAMYGATPSDFGPNPIQRHQIEVMCAGVAAIAKKYDIDCQNAVMVYTHAEAAIRDSYFPGDPVVAGMAESGPPYRWDLERLEAGPQPLSKDAAVAVGNQLRARAHEYKLALT